jgi:hypothetical protein
MQHLKAINQKASRIEEHVAPQAQPELAAAAEGEGDVVALQQRGGGPPQQPAGPRIPMGCSTVFSPGWEVDGGTRPVRLSRRVLLAGAGPRPAESRARLDRQMRGGAARLAKN